MPAFFSAAILSAAEPAAAGDDRPGVAHAPARRRRLAGDERGHRLRDVLRDVLGRLLLGGAADLADHQDRLGPRVVLEHLQQVDLVRADDRVAADADARRLRVAQVRELEDGLVGERAGAADDADALLPGSPACGCSRA